MGKLIGFFFFFFLLVNNKMILVLHLNTTESLWIPYEIWKVVSCCFRAWHQHRGAAPLTLLQWQKLSKGLLGPRVSFEEVRCHYIQLKMQSFRMNGKTQQRIWIEGWVKPLLPFPQSKLPHPLPIHTYTNTRICIYKITYKSQGKINYLLHVSAFQPQVTLIFSCRMNYPKYSGRFKALGTFPLCCLVQVTSEGGWKEGSLAEIVLLKRTDSVIGSTF